MPNAFSTFDLAVIGGGPAGSSAAITAARQGARVLLLEAHEFPRDKVCGEFVSAEALELLANLLRDLPAGCSLLQAALLIRRTRFFLAAWKLEAPIAPPAVSIPRYDLDARLWEAAQLAGVATQSGCEVTALDGNGQFGLTTLSGRYSARAVIVAAGRWSQFTPDRSVPAGPRWIGVKGHFREPDAGRTTDLYFFDHGYAGVQPVAQDVVSSCAMVRSDYATTLAEACQLHPKLAQRAARWTAVTQPVSTAPLLFGDAHPVHGNIMYAGDAAAFIDPFVGDGISIALRTGRLAAESAGKFLSGEASLIESVELYRREYARQFAPLLATAARVRSLMSLSRAGRAAAFQLLRLPGVMPYLIRKTRRAA